MLSQRHFYFKLLRKYVILFGNIFNDIHLIRYDKTGKEVSKIKVPIAFGPKEKYVVRFEQSPDFFRDVQIVLPRMSFEYKNFTYDAARKQNALLRSAKGADVSRLSSQYMGVPYDIDFELNIYARNTDDGNQIIEQILPHFNPDYTVTIEPVTELGFLKDIPIVLNSISPVTEYEGNFDSVRYVTWTLSFTVKGYFFGPISTPKIIRKSIANIFNDPSLVTGYVIRMNLGDGSGAFKEGDIIYQGDTFENATAYATIINWRPTDKKLLVSGAQGQFKAGETIRAGETNANYLISSFDVTPVKLAEIVVEPDPIDANPGDDFGYTTTITEWPDTENLEPPAEEENDD